MELVVAATAAMELVFTATTAMEIVVAATTAMEIVVTRTEIVVADAETHHHKSAPTATFASITAINRCCTHCNIIQLKQ